jgi:hypothetical protein
MTEPLDWREFETEAQRKRRECYERTWNEQRGIQGVVRVDEGSGLRSYVGQWLDNLASKGNGSRRQDERQ